MKTLIQLLTLVITIVIPLNFCWSDIVEDFNGDSLNPGFTIAAWDGSGTPNANGESWTFSTAPDEWRYVGLISPRFSGDAFRFKVSCKDFVSQLEAWEWIALVVKGHNFEASFTFGLNEEAYLYFDSGLNVHGGYGPNTVPLILEDLYDFPAELDMEIEYNGPGQPIQFYYALDDGERTSADALTLDAPGDLQGDFDATVELRGGEYGPLGASLDSLEIIGANVVEPPQGQIVHELSQEISTVQGQDNWYYRVGTPYEGTAMRDLTWSETAYGNWVKSYWYDVEADPDQTNWVDIIDVLTIGGPRVSLNVDTSPRLEWESPYDGEQSAEIAGTFKLDSDHPDCIGYILLNGEVVWESDLLTVNGEVEGFRVSVPQLNRGDVITFTAEGAQWAWVQFVHTRIEIEGDETKLTNWSTF